MRYPWAMPRLAAQALILLFLASFVCCGAFGSWLGYLREVYQNVPAARGRRQMESFKTISMWSRRRNPAFSDDSSEALWLSNLRCSIFQPQLFGSKSASGSYWEYAKRCVRVGLGWSPDMVSMLPNMLRKQEHWKGPGTLSISQRSWAIMDAADLATWLQHTSWWASDWLDLMYLRYWGEDPPLPICKGHLAATRHGGSSPFVRERETEQVNSLLNAMAEDASKFAIESLHISVTHSGNDSFAADTAGSRLEKNSDLSDDTFARLATSLATAPNLQQTSISWHSHPNSDVEAGRTLEAVTARLAESNSLRKLSIFRSDGSCRFNSGLFATFIRAARVHGGWRNLETLSITTRDCHSLGGRGPVGELQALQSLLEQMPALRHVHMEYRDSTAFSKRFYRHDGLWLDPLHSNMVPGLGEWVRHVSDQVSVTLKTSNNDLAGAVRADTLAPLSGALNDGNAVVVSASNLRVLLGATQRDGVPDITALTIVTTFSSHRFAERLMKAGQPVFSVPVRLLPNLERLAIDSRWTGGYCNDLVVGLPPELGAGLSALMVHTIELFMHDEESMAVEALLGLLRIGRNIVAVELGVSILWCTTTGVAVFLSRLVETLSRMPHLKAARLHLHSVPGRHDTGLLRALTRNFASSLAPVAGVRVIMNQSAAHPPPANLQFDRYGDPVGWRLNLTANVPLTPFFPSPRQFYTQDPEGNA